MYIPGPIDRDRGSASMEVPTVTSVTSGQKSNVVQTLPLCENAVGERHRDVPYARIHDLNDPQVSGNAA